MENYILIKERPNQKTSEILAKMKKKFDVWCYCDDKRLDKDFPAPKEATERTFRNRVEADKEHKNKSANDLEKEGVKGITLRERLIWELEYFEKTGEHLDIENITLCSGSRYSGGHVPSVDWNRDGREVHVNWYSPASRRGNLRSRACVSDKIVVELGNEKDNNKKWCNCPCERCGLPRIK